MLEQIMDLLKLAVRQKNSVYFAVEAFKNCFDGFSVKKIFSVFIAVIEMFGSVLFDTPFTDAELSQYGTDYKTQMIVDYVKIWQQ